MQNGFESMSLIVADQVFYIFQYKARRSMMGDNPGYIKKKRSLGFTQKSMLSTQTVFFTNASKAEGLTGKTG